MPIHKTIAPKKLEDPIGKFKDLAGKKYVNTMFFNMGSQPNLAKLNTRISGKAKSILRKYSPRPLHRRE